MGHGAACRDLVAGLLSCLLVSAACSKPPPPTIVVDFGMTPDELVGARVEVDGKVVGVLARDGQRPRTSFPIAKGRHAVRVLHPKYDAEPAQVSLAAGDELVMFVEYGKSPGGATKPALALRH